MMNYIVGDCREVLSSLPSGSAQCCVTSPPYYGLRDYGVAGQIGLEPTPDEYVAEMVAVFREVRRVLRDDGVLFLNIGDSYHNLRTHMNGGAPTNTVHRGTARDGTEGFGRTNRSHRLPGIKDKDLIGIPWLLAFALRADGWFLRSDIIWHKPNPMPESVRDRPTSAHEHVFLLTKGPRYYYDAEAVMQPMAAASALRLAQDVDAQAGSDRANGGTRADRPMKALRPKGNARTFRGGIYTGGAAFDNSADMARDSHGNAPNESGLVNLRNVWTIATRPFKGAHFATMPPYLAERCILAGSRPGDVVLDPFGGAGTTGVAADRLGRHSVLIDLSTDYAAMAEARLMDDRVKRLPPGLRGLL
jgi:DNA modification methylase